MAMESMDALSMESMDALSLDVRALTPTAEMAMVFGVVGGYWGT